MGDKVAQPLYARGETVSYVDRQKRLQRGEVLVITAHWNYGPEPYIIYTLRHPTYAGKRFHAGAEDIYGSAKITPPGTDAEREASHG